jgi:hypothetical protein
MVLLALEGWVVNAWILGLDPRATALAGLCGAFSASSSTGTSARRTGWAT